MKSIVVLAVVMASLGGGLGTAFAQRPANTPPAPAAPAGDRKFDFTPTVTELVSDGIPYRSVVFRDGNRRMQVNPPAKWVAAGSPGEMYFQNPEMSGARITLRASSLPVPEKMDEAWLESVKPLVLASLPKTSNKQLIANVTPNTINIAGWTSAEFKATYEVAGKRFASAWLFLRLADGRLLEVICNSRDEDFPAVRGAMLETLRGWGSAPLAAGSR